MKKLATILSLILITNISLADCHDCGLGRQPESVGQGTILMAKVGTQVASRSIASEKESPELHLSLACTYAGGRSMKSVAEALQKAGLSFKSIEDLNSFKCDMDFSLLETMIYHANYNTIELLVRYYRVKLGKERAKELLNYKIPNRRNGGYHTALDFVERVDKYVDDESVNEYLDKVRALFIENGAERLNLELTF